MSQTWLKLSMVLLIAVFGVLLAASPAFAETPLGAGPDNPMSPSGDWVELPVGAWHFYGFHEEGDGEDVRVEMQVVPHYGTTFEIWSKEEVKKWADEIKFEPFGGGTFSCDCKPEDEVGKMNWLGEFAASGDYFVVVKHKAGALSHYKLTISGKEVSFPFQASAPATPVAEPAAAPVAAPIAEPATVGGATPATAMAPTGEWTELPAGGESWYKFTYVADRGVKGDQDPPEIKIAMYVDKPIDNARFDVWTQEEVDRLIAEGEDILGEDTTKGHCVGCGGENEFEKGDYFWSGSFLKSGVYYVRVQHTPCRCEPAYYQLLVSGTSVSY
jgi:hypothetical protein